MPAGFTGPAPSGTVAANLLATTKAFDFDADSSTGDYWFSSLLPPPDPTAKAGLAALGTSGGRYLAAAKHQGRLTPVKTAKADGVPGCGTGLVLLGAGQACAITVTITPGAGKGSVVRGPSSSPNWPSISISRTPLRSATPRTRGSDTSNSTSPSLSAMKRWAFSSRPSQESSPFFARSPNQSRVAASCVCSSSAERRLTGWHRS